MEEEDVSCLWLLKTVKKIIAGIDNKDNKISMLYEALMSFFTMRQEETESNDSFLNRFKSNVQTLELVRGSNVLYSTGHLGSRDGINTTDIYKKNNREKFLAICFFF